MALLLLLPPSYCPSHPPHLPAHGLARWPASTTPPLRAALSMRLEEHQAAEEADEAAFEALMISQAEEARSEKALSSAREAAVKRAEALASDPAVTAKLEKGGSAPTGKIAKLLKKPKGTLALIGEGVRIEVNSMGGFDLDDPAYLSGQFREGGCTAAMVSVAERNALADDALIRTIAEQESVRGDFPGPLPVLARDDFLEPTQLAAVAAAGAKMCLLSLNLAGDRIANLMTEAERLGLEPVVRVCDEAELASAVELGAKVLCIGDVSTSQAEELIGKVPQGVITIADFEARDVRGVWRIRDMGFNAAIIGKGLLDVCVRDRVPPTAVIKAMLSKGSVKFGLGMQKGRLEGSKEYLGTIAM